VAIHLPPELIGDPRGIIDACGPDMECGPEGTRTTLELESDRLVICIDARDTASFRAALNAHLRCVELALEVARRAAGDDRGR
jgi:tRNA threonylcarbamoyladenosine modification (KEOPS) complex  Pcc1 subunit